MSTLLSDDDSSSRKPVSKDSKPIVQLPADFTIEDVEKFLIVAKRLRTQSRAFVPDEFQMMLLISVANSFLFKYKLPLRLTSVIN